MSSIFALVLFGGGLTPFPASASLFPVLPLMTILKKAKVVHVPLTRAQQIENLTSSMTQFLAPLDLHESEIRVLTNGGVQDYDHIRSGFRAGLFWGSNTHEVIWSPGTLGSRKSGGTHLFMEHLSLTTPPHGTEARIQIHIKGKQKLIVTGVKDTSPTTPPYITNVDGCQFLEPVPISGFLALIALRDQYTLQNSKLTLPNATSLSFSIHPCTPPTTRPWPRYVFLTSKRPLDFLARIKETLILVHV